MSVVGAGGGTRTHDPLITSQVLYQLNYASENPSHAAASMWWMGLDSNQRSVNAADLQSAPFGQLGHPSMGSPTYVYVRR